MRLQRWLVEQKGLVIRGFLVLYCLVILAGLVEAGKITSNGKVFGQLALLALTITLTPGIMRRLKIEFWWVGTLMYYRRQVGILTYLLAFTHYALLRLIPVALGRLPMAAPAAFEIFGMIALFLMTPVFLTSNNWSVRRLGKWWKRVHSVVYVVIWLVFFHTAFQLSYFWAGLSGLFGILEIVSWIVFWQRRRSRPP